MDFIGGALPNVMFLVGIIAFGVGLGLEFKIIEVKNGLTRGGRIMACLMGVVLMAASVALYLRPAAPIATSASAASAAVGAPDQTPGTGAAAVAALPTATTATDAPGITATSEPSATAAPATATTEPSATVAPTATLVPTSMPTTVPLVAVPDLSGLDPKKAREALEQLGLQLGEQRETCADLGAGGSEAAEVRRGRIACQEVASGTLVPLQTAVDYVLSDTK
ncbi:MAG TPA: PASTA domain-containing protein [Chloroflexaceae bacterium]|nr:PASTA domain-containing protein [Chloroflexaceae bacterium]